MFRSMRLMTSQNKWEALSRCKFLPLRACQSQVNVQVGASQLMGLKGDLGYVQVEKASPETQTQLQGTS